MHKPLLFFYLKINRFYLKSIRFPSWFLFNKNLFPQPVDFRALKCYINSCMHYY